jgi:hypothetical protein
MTRVNIAPITNGIGFEGGGFLFFSMVPDPSNPQKSVTKITDILNVDVTNPHEDIIRQTCEKLFTCINLTEKTKDTDPYYLPPQYRV